MLIQSDYKKSVRTKQEHADIAFVRIFHLNKGMKQLVSNTFFQKLFGLLSIVIIFLFLYKLYMPHVNAFGCFDDCFNFMGGYFLLHGKQLYTQIFFNHNPGMAYISALIQWSTHPVNLYDLVLRHRQVVWGFGFLMSLFLFWRFGYVVIGFIFLYEFAKFYIFGDRFLAEGIIVYPLVFLTGLVWQNLKKNRLSLVDYVLAALCCWFVVFMREPYVPLALSLFAFTLISKKQMKEKIIAVIFFFALSLGTLLYHNIPEFFFSVYTTNLGVTFASETASHGGFLGNLWTAAIYPISIFFGGKWSFFRYILLELDTLFLLSIGYLLWRKQWIPVILIIGVLTFANLRIVAPGQEFYEAFHMIPWYALFVFFSLLMLSFLAKQHKKLGFILLICYFLIFVFMIIGKGSFIHDKANTSEEFLINYGDTMQVGDVFRTLSQPSDKLFLDGFDDIIYWVSQRYSDYQYSWYTSLMPAFPKYTNARLSLFAKNPPDFYYGTCPKEKDPQRILPAFIQANYTRLYKLDKPSCLWVKNTKLSQITNVQWQQASQYFYNLPSEKSQ